ncbi:hypothetical protein GEMRC1_003145 [Eukaryota sp. GEM-RC1]
MNCVNFSPCRTNFLFRRPIRITICGAAGRIGHQLSWAIVNGLLFGSQQQIDLMLYDVDKEEQQTMLQSFILEVNDCAFPTVSALSNTKTLGEAFMNRDIVILTASKGNVKPGQTRFDLISSNAPIYAQFGQELEKHANTNCKILIVGNPVNTLSLIVSSHAPSIPITNWFGMTYTDHLRAEAKMKEMMESGDEKDVNFRIAIYGCHSETLSGSLVTTCANSKSMEEDMVNYTRFRYKDIQKANPHAGSTLTTPVYGTLVTLRYIMLGSMNESFTVAVRTDGHVYGIPADLFSSLPAVSNGRSEIQIVEDFPVSDFARQRIEETVMELQKEKESAMQWMGRRHEEPRHNWDTVSIRQLDSIQ